LSRPKNKECPKSEENLWCVYCGELITQPKRGPRRELTCSNRCTKLMYTSSDSYRKKKAEYDKQYRLLKDKEIKEKGEAYRNSDRGRYIQKVSKLRYSFGLSEEEYRDLLDSCSGCCEICRESLGAPHVDHDHKTGKIRGLLCQSCNMGLGHFKDNTNFLLYAYNYLKENSK